MTTQVDFGGDTTSYSYAWSSSIATTGLGTFGGWAKYATNSAGKSNVEVTDFFGRTIDKWDFGGHDYDYSFNLAGRLVTRTNSLGENVAYSYYNTGLMASIATTYDAGYTGSTATSSFKYDAEGNRTFEGHVVAGWYTNWYYGGTINYSTTHQQASVTWDAMNRMTSFVDPGTSSSPFNISWEYDLSSNIRRMKSVFRYMDAQGVVATTDTTQESWYKSDAMNRFVPTKGMLIWTNASGVMVTGDAARGLADAGVNRYATGTDIVYNLSGQRVSAAKTNVLYYCSESSRYVS